MVWRAYEGERHLPWPTQSPDSIIIIQCGQF
jgi:hypothetical protein